MRKTRVASLIIAVFFLLSSAVQAHQPRIVSEKTVKVSNPEVSQAFYGELQGAKNVYEIHSDQSFDLYVRLLVPDIEGARKDFSAEIYTQEEFTGENGEVMQRKTTIALLNGLDHNWTGYYEPFAGDNYLQGPEFRNKETEALQGVGVEAGTYLVQVFNPDNEGKYVLAIGAREEFSLGGMLETIKTLPSLKSDYFGKSPLLAFWNLTGLYLFFFGLVIILVIWAIIRRRKKSEKKTDLE